MEHLLVLSLFTVLIVLVTWLSRVLARLLKRPKLRYLFYFIGLALLFGDIPLAHLQLKYLCEWQNVDDIIEITKPLKTYPLGLEVGCEAKCQKALIHYKIKTVELETDEPDPKLWTDKEGKYEFYLSQTGDPNCKLFEEHPVLAEGYTLPENTCIAGRIVPKDDTFDMEIIDDSSSIISGSKFEIRTTEQPPKRLLFDYIQKKEVKKEKVTGEVIRITYYYLVQESWLWDLIAKNFLGSQVPGYIDCYGPNIHRHPDLVKEGGIYGR